MQQMSRYHRGSRQKGEELPGLGVWKSPFPVGQLPRAECLSTGLGWPWVSWANLIANRAAMTVGPVLLFGKQNSFPLKQQSVC